VAIVPCPPLFTIDLHFDPVTVDYRAARASVRILTESIQYSIHFGENLRRKSINQSIYNKQKKCAGSGREHSGVHPFWTASALIALTASFFSMHIGILVALVA
jgi:hypothetical protein